ncbi:MAG TPA: hypothetical protein VEQ15_00320 [Myxococcales bacterium]|nr:hypothetical protein [Myxococcales bacterium]
MEVTLAGGGVIDIATRDEIVSHHDRLESLLSKSSVHGQRLYGQTPTGAGPLVIDLGSPPMGMLWIPQYICVFGAAPFLGAGNIFIANVSAAVLAGSLPRPQQLALGPPVTGADYGGVLAVGLQLPGSDSIPAGKTPVYGNEHLYVILAGTGLAAGSATVYQATAYVLEAPDSPSTLSV